MTRWTMLLLTALGSLTGVGGVAADDVVTVRLKPAASAPDQRVSVEDVASLEGGTLGLRHRIGRLDVAELPVSGEPQQVTRGQVAFRIQLGGVEKERFRVLGAERVAVTLARTKITEEEVLAAAEQYVRQRLPGNAADATIRVVRSPSDAIVIDADRAEVRLEAESRTTGLPLGRVQVEVNILVQGAKRRSIPVQLDVKMQQTVTVASRRIERGEELSAANLRHEMRTVDGLNQFATAAESLLGKKAKQPIPAGQTVALRDVEVPAPASAVLIKQRDRVRVMARLGSDYVMALGEAMQEGRDGQLIQVQVRHGETKKTVLGRVVGQGMVEVDY